MVRRAGALALAEFGGLGTEGGGRRHLGNDGQATQFHQRPRATYTKCEPFFLFCVFEGRKKVNTKKKRKGAAYWDNSFEEAII